MEKKIKLSLAFLISISFLLLFFSTIGKSYAYYVCRFGSEDCAAVNSCAVSNCTDQKPPPCSTQGNGACNNACTSSCDCANQANTQSWAKYNAVCIKIPGAFGKCDWAWSYTNASCSTSDKCTSVANNPYLNYGTCSCTAGNIYKTCCNSNGTLSSQSCVQYAGDSTNPPWEGNCPSGTTIVACNVPDCTVFTNAGYKCTTGACGASACSVLGCQNNSDCAGQYFCGNSTNACNQYNKVCDLSTHQCVSDPNASGAGSSPHQTNSASCIGNAGCNLCNSNTDCFGKLYSCGTGTNACNQYNTKCDTSTTPGTCVRDDTSSHLTNTALCNGNGGATCPTPSPGGVACTSTDCTPACTGGKSCTGTKPSSCSCTGTPIPSTPPPTPAPTPTPFTTSRCYSCDNNPPRCIYVDQPAGYTCDTNCAACSGNNNTPPPCDPNYYGEAPYPGGMKFTLNPPSFSYYFYPILISRTGTANFGFNLTSSTCSNWQINTINTPAAAANGQVPPPGATPKPITCPNTTPQDCRTGACVNTSETDGTGTCFGTDTCCSGQRPTCPNIAGQSCGNYQCSTINQVNGTGTCYSGQYCCAPPTCTNTAGQYCMPNQCSTYGSQLGPWTNGTGTCTQGLNCCRNPVGYSPKDSPFAYFSGRISTFVKTAFAQIDFSKRISGFVKTAFAQANFSVPVFNGCIGLPGTNPTCTVETRNTPLGAYTTTVTSNNVNGTATDTKTFPLDIYVVDSVPLTATCTLSAYGAGYTKVVLSWPSAGSFTPEYVIYDNGVYVYNVMGQFSPMPANNRLGDAPTTATISLANGTHNLQVQAYKYTGANADNMSLATNYLAEKSIVSNNGSCTAPTPTPAPVTNTISGNVFVDNNPKNAIKDPGESNYSGAITITSSNGGTITYPTSGAFNVGSLTAGTYTISYTSLPSGYTMTNPVNGPPPSFTVTVGTGCSAGGSNSASCDAGNNITNLNFGISNAAVPWVQTSGSDIRADNGFSSGGGSGGGGGGGGGGTFNNPIPLSAVAACGGPHTSIADNVTSKTPGLVFTGNDSSPNFGQGDASVNKWVSGGMYGPTKIGGIIRSSYSYLVSVAKQAGITPVDLTASCGGDLNTCQINTSTFTHGIYLANGNLNLSFTSPYTLKANQNYIILVNGDLYIKTPIHVPNGSTLLISTSGSIYVDSSVGETSYLSSSANIEGIFSADKNFVVQGANNCAVTTDLKLNVAGSIITNAALAGGNFVNQRDLCANNAYCPVFTVQSRPDFILNAPAFIKRANYTWQEAAP